MPRLRDLDLDRHLTDPGLKQQFVTPMFDLVAPRYDDFTRAFSFNMDRGWKAALVRHVAMRVPPSARVLDLACGTGDLAFGVAAAVPGARVTGVDASARMLEGARRRAGQRASPPPDFRLGDIAHLEAPDGSADGVTAGYAFRNVPDHGAALREAARVLRRGGTIAVLDFYRPVASWWRAVFLGYLSVAGKAFGWFWHREPVAYGYIAPSIDRWITVDDFSHDLAAAGFNVVRVESHLGGAVAIHVAERT